MDSFSLLASEGHLTVAGNAIWSAIWLSGVLMLGVALFVFLKGLKSGLRKAPTAALLIGMLASIQNILASLFGALARSGQTEYVWGAVVGAFTVGVAAWLALRLAKQSV